MSPPPRVVIVDHYDSYTGNLMHLVAEVTGVLPTLVQHDTAKLSEVLSFDVVLLSPGPGSPTDRGDFGLGTAVLRAAQRPVFGVCLGMQGMVTAWGGEVSRARPAHGEVARITHDGRGVFRGLPPEFAAVRYHSLQASVVPEQLVVTATSEDGAVMGVRHRELPQEGVQFHPESILSEYGADLIRNFLAVLR